jgi:hypothetical protein
MNAVIPGRRLSTPLQQGYVFISTSSLSGPHLGLNGE